MEGSKFLLYVGPSEKKRRNKKEKTEWRGSRRGEQTVKRKDRVEET